MKDIRGIVVCASVMFAMVAGLTLVGAQDAPAPGPEHEKLGYFVGNWTNTGTISENPMGIPTGKFRGKDRCEWFEGKFAVICHSDGSGPMGEVKGLGILGYDPMAKIYTYYSVDSTGMTMTTVPRGKVDGKTWTYNDQAEMGGMTIKNRFIMVESSATSYTFKWEIEGQDGWTTVMDGVARKG